MRRRLQSRSLSRKPNSTSTQTCRSEFVEVSKTSRHVTFRTPLISSALTLMPVSLSLIRVSLHLLEYFQAFVPLSLPRFFTTERRGNKWGRIWIYLPLWHTPINTHRKWQLRGSGTVTRDGDVGIGLTPICCCVCTGKHRLFWLLERHLHGDSLGIIHTAFLQQVPRADHVQTHKHKHRHTHVVRRRGQSGRRQALTNARADAAAHNRTNGSASGESNAHVSHLSRNCVSSVAPFHPSHPDSQSLFIRAVPAPTEKSIVRRINKRIKAI